MENVQRGKAQMKLRRNFMFIKYFAARTNWPEIARWS